MLVLSRRLGERIVIGTDIVLEVVAIGPGQVRLGFTAPPETEIMREELLGRDAVPPRPTRKTPDRGRRS